MKRRLPASLFLVSALCLLIAALCSCSSSETQRTSESSPVDPASSGFTVASSEASADGSTIETPALTVSPESEAATTVTPTPTPTETPTPAPTGTTTPTPTETPTPTPTVTPEQDRKIRIVKTGTGIEISIEMPEHAGEEASFVLLREQKKDTWQTEDRDALIDFDQALLNERGEASAFLHQKNAESAYLYITVGNEEFCKEVKLK